MAKQEKAAKISEPRKELEWRGEYDFAEDGGAVGSFPLRGDGPIPEGAVIFDGYVDVETPVASASGGHAQLAVLLGADAVLPAQRGWPAWPVGRYDIIQQTPAFVPGAEDAPRVVVSTEPITAGKFQLVLFYFEPSEAVQAAIKERKEQEAEAAKRAEDERKAAAKEAKKAEK